MEFRHALLLVTIFAAVPAHASDGKLKVDLYAESLCPYCRRFILDVVEPLYANGLGDEMEFTAYYAGNIRIVADKLVCQHGVAECYLNRVLNCGIAKSSGITMWLPFVECIETYAEKAVDSENTVQSCCKKAGLKFHDVKACYKGDEGEQLHREAFNKTMELQPPKKYVPWVVVNGVPLYEDMFALPRMLCIHRTADKRPKMCYENDFVMGLDRANVLSYRTYPDDIPMVV